jgi:hypothetical protein
MNPFGQSTAIGCVWQILEVDLNGRSGLGRNGRQGTKGRCGKDLEPVHVIKL